jgi:hypothetical protein
MRKLDEAGIPYTIEKSHSQVSLQNPICDCRQKEDGRLRQLSVG